MATYFKMKTLWSLPDKSLGNLLWHGNAKHCLTALFCEKIPHKMEILILIYVAHKKENLWRAHFISVFSKLHMVGVNVREWAWYTLDMG